MATDDMTGMGSGRAGSAASEAVRRGRQALGRSFRLQRPRGAFCHAGWCQQCKITLSDGRVALACELPAADYAKIVRMRRWRLVFGVVARRLPPWFHERVMLPVSWAQNLFLEIVRRATGAQPLPTGAADAGRAATLTCDTVVVGNGTAGLAAAETLQRMGTDVVLVGYGDGDASPAAAYRHLPRTLALGIYSTTEPEIWQLLCAGKEGATDIRYRRMVVATGAYDRLLPIPGNDLPGIVGMDAFKRLASEHAIPEQTRIGVVAPPEAAEALVAAAQSAGLRVDWVATTSALTSRAGPRVHVGAKPVRAAGKARLSGVLLDNGRTEPCDMLVVGYRQPAYELFVQSGLEAEYVAPGEAIRVTGKARFPILGVGEAVGQSGDIADQVRERVEAWANGRTSFPLHPVAGLPLTSPIPDDTIVCPCEDVSAGEIRQAIAAGFDNIEHLKRRTGAATGPCQGKLCHCLVMQCLDDAGCSAGIPTMRPLARPVRLATFAGEPS